MGKVVEDGISELTLDDLAGEAAVLGVYRQAFAVLAREAGAMILDASLLDVDESILQSFADSGADGMTLEQVVAACRGHDEARVRRRFAVLREYGAVTRVNERSNELFYRAAFAPYVMLMFLRRITEMGGQAELHQLLSVERRSVDDPRATQADGRATAHRLTTVFRLLANQLAGLAAGDVVENLREHAKLLWGNHALLDEADAVHGAVLRAWPALDRECQALRLAVAAYRDAVDAAAGRLIEQAGTTRALGLLPVEAWRTFARRSDVPALASVLDGFLFDAPAPWFTTESLVEAVESGRRTTGTRLPPPRQQTASPPPDRPTAADEDTDRLAALAERALGARSEVTIAELLDEAGDWISGRRLLAELTAAHHHDDLPYRIEWGTSLRINPDSDLSWINDGRLRRTPPTGSGAGAGAGAGAGRHDMR